jgi:hypothetical protein
MFLIALIRQNVFNSYDLNSDLGILLHTTSTFIDKGETHCPFKRKKTILGVFGAFLD